MLSITGQSAWLHLPSIPIPPPAMWLAWSHMPGLSW